MGDSGFLLPATLKVKKSHLVSLVPFSVLCGGGVLMCLDHNPPAFISSYVSAVQFSLTPFSFFILTPFFFLLLKVCLEP